MNSIGKVRKLGQIAKSALDNYVQRQNSLVKGYHNVEHHLMADYEVQVPSKEESYIFDGNIWTLSIVNNNIIVKKKKSR